MLQIPEEDLFPAYYRFSLDWDHWLKFKDHPYAIHSKTWHIFYTVTEITGSCRLYLVPDCLKGLRIRINYDPVELGSQRIHFNNQFQFIPILNKALNPLWERMIRDGFIHGIQRHKDYKCTIWNFKRPDWFDLDQIEEMYLCNN